MRICCIRVSDEYLRPRKGPEGKRIVAMSLSNTCSLACEELASSRLLEGLMKLSTVRCSGILQCITL
jgi:hypothetical protein